jgi:hypothetical protein
MLSSNSAGLLKIDIDVCPFFSLFFDRSIELLYVPRKLGSSACKIDSLILLRTASVGLRVKRKEKADNGVDD